MAAAGKAASPAVALPPDPKLTAKETETLPGPPVLPDTPLENDNLKVLRKSSIKGALKNSTAAETASAACVIAAIIALIFMHTPILRVPTFLIYLAVAFGIWKMSRTAAIIGLVIASANVVAVLLVGFSHPSAVEPGSVAYALILNGLWIKFLYDAVRSSFAYHRARSATP